MSEMKKGLAISPSPWEDAIAQTAGTTDFRACILDAGNQPVCLALDNSPTAKANVRLMSVAPEMYELLDRIRGRLEFCRLEQSIDIETEREIRELLAKARAEVAK